MVRLAQLAAVAALTLALSACATIPASPPIASGESSAVLNGVRHWYKVAGNAAPGAPPVVFLHGGPGGDTYTFEHSAGRLMERDLQLVYFEQRGSGRSDKPADGDYAVTNLVEDLEALRRHLGVPRVSIITHSFGTVIGLSYAAKYPDRVARMVIAGGLADAPASCRESAARLKQNRPDAFANAFPEGTEPVSDAEICGKVFRAIPGRAGEAYRELDMFPTTASRDRFKALQAASGLRNAGEFGAYQFRNGLLQWRFPDAPRVTMPVLVIGGEADWAAGPQAQRSLARGLPRGQFVEMPGAGHWMFVDEPEAFARLAAGFLNSSRQH